MNRGSDGQHFARPPSSDVSPADRQAAAKLVGLLINATGSKDKAPSVDHRAADRRYQAPFGDGLTAVLKDVLGEAADPPFRPVHRPLLARVPPSETVPIN